MSDITQLPGTERDNVEYLDMATTLDLPVDRVIKGALEKDLEQVVVIGWDEEGNLYLASSTGRQADIVHLLEFSKLAILGG